MKIHMKNRKAIYTFDSLSIPKVFRVKIGEAGTPIIEMPLPLGGNKKRQEINAKRVVKCWNYHDELLELAEMVNKVASMITFPDEGELNDLKRLSRRIIKKATK